MLHFDSVARSAAAVVHFKLVKLFVLTISAMEIAVTLWTKKFMKFFFLYFETSIGMAAA